MKKAVAIGAVLIVSWFLLIFILPEFREDLPALRNHVQTAEKSYSTLDKVKYHSPSYGGFWVELYVSDMSESEEIKDDFQAFLSSDIFLSEFLATPEIEKSEEASSGLMPYRPDIYLTCTLSSETEEQWRSTAMYYTQPYRSDEIMEVDGYQTWYDETE